MSFCRFAIRMTLALALVGGAASTAGATSIVFNGGFETGDFTGWSLGGNTGFTGVQCPGPGLSVAEGNCSAFFGQVGSTGTLSQTLTTVVGQSYQIRFAFAPDGGVPSFFSASFDGVTPISLTNPASSPFQFLSFFATANSTSTALQFTFRDDPGFISLDAVSVEAAVPEPMTLSLVGLGLGCARLLRSKRKSNQA